MKLLTKLIAGWLLISSAAGARLIAEESAANRDTFHLILLAPVHPVFIRLETQADGAGLRNMRARYVTGLFQQYDRDGDGSLSKEEAGRIPPLVKTAGMSETFSIVDTWVSVDAHPADDRVSPEELVDYLDRILGSPLAVSIRPKRVEQSIDLFEVLDLNRDGRLALDELARAPDALRKRDADDDESLSIEELTGIRSGGIPSVAVPADRQSSDVPLIAINTPAEIAEAARRLLERYGETSKQLAALSREQLGLTAVTMSAADANGDESLDLEELKALLAKPAAHLVLHLELFQSQPGKPRWTVVDDPLQAVTRPARSATDQLTLAVNGISLELKAVSTRGESRDNRKFFQQRFRQTDTDKNKYLNEQEFAGLMENFAQAGMQQTTFAIVDRNSDGMVTQEELLAFVDQDSAAQQSRVELVLSHDGKSVFQVLDAAPDRRLTRRELLQATERMKTMDLDGDGTVTPVEMVGRYRMQAELGRPALFRTTGGGGRGNDLSPVVGSPTEGPAWFRKMDRNRDGDVSHREFLGGRALFERLDTDGDGLISAKEADAAGDPEGSPESPKDSTPVK